MPPKSIADGADGNGSKHVEGDVQKEKPGTLVVNRRPPGDAPTGKHDTIMVSSSSKAQARIKVCLKCNHDNPGSAVYCEGCGATLDELESKRSAEEADRRMEKLARKAVKSSGQNKTVFRRGGGNRPARGSDVVVEKKKFHSQYIPPAAGADPLAGYRPNTYDPSGFYQGSEYPGQHRQPLPGEIYPVQYVQVPSGEHGESQTSWIVGVVVAAALFVILSGLVAAIVVLALK